MAWLVSTQALLHCRRSVGHVHTPPTQLVPTGQTLPQVPQFDAFELKTTQLGPH
jgi:hypothetical protein